MKRKINLGLVFIVTFFISLQVNAVQSCTSSEMERLKELAKNVKFQTSYEMNVDEANRYVYLEYRLNILNFDPDIKIVFQPDSKSDPIELTSTSETGFDFPEDTYVHFKVYSYTNNLCTDRLLKTYTVNFPAYNDYYYFNRDKCEEHPDFKYCKEFMNVDSTDFKKIDKEFDDYLKEEKAKNKSTNNLLWYIVGGVALVGVLVGVIILIIKIKKRRDEF